MKRNFYINRIYEYLIKINKEYKSIIDELINMNNFTKEELYKELSKTMEYNIKDIYQESEDIINEIFNKNEDENKYLKEENEKLIKKIEKFKQLNNNTYILNQICANNNKDDKNYNKDFDYERKFNNEKDELFDNNNKNSNHILNNKNNNYINMDINKEDKNNNKIKCNDNTKNKFNKDNIIYKKKTIPQKKLNKSNHNINHQTIKLRESDNNNEEKTKQIKNSNKKLKKTSKKKKTKNFINKKLKREENILEDNLNVINEDINVKDKDGDIIMNGQIEEKKININIIKDNKGEKDKRKCYWLIQAHNIEELNLIKKEINKNNENKIIKIVQINEKINEFLLLLYNENRIDISINPILSSNIYPINAKRKINYINFMNNIGSDFDETIE